MLGKPLKRFSASVCWFGTGLKPGVNVRALSKAGPNQRRGRSPAVALCLLRGEGHAHLVGARCRAKSDVESIPAVNRDDGQSQIY